MKKAKVIFSVGVSHTLYEKEVCAVILNENCGFDGRQVYARTVEPVHFDEDPEGIIIFNKWGSIIGFEKSPLMIKFMRVIARLLMVKLFKLWIWNLIVALGEKSHKEFKKFFPKFLKKKVSSL
jgi:hypothetical protein